MKWEESKGVGMEEKQKGEGKGNELKFQLSYCRISGYVYNWLADKLVACWLVGQLSTCVRRVNSSVCSWRHRWNSISPTTTNCSVSATPGTMFRTSNRCWLSAERQHSASPVSTATLLLLLLSSLLLLKKLYSTCYNKDIGAAWNRVNGRNILKQSTVGEHQMLRCVLTYDVLCLEFCSERMCWGSWF